MKFERIMVSGIVVDGDDPGSDPRLTLHDIAWSAEKERWGGHHPDRVTIVQHSLAMARRCLESMIADGGYNLYDVTACIWHDIAETFVEDMPTLLKHQPHMAEYRETEHRVLESLLRRFAPGLLGYDWARIKPLDRAALRVESERFPATLDRDTHKPFDVPALGLTWEGHYRPRSHDSRHRWITAARHFSEAL